MKPLVNLAQTIVLTLLVISIFALAEIAVRQPTQQPQQSIFSESTKTKQPSKEKEKPFWVRTVDDPVSLFTAILVAFTGVLAVVSVIQIRLLTRADETAKIAANAAMLSAQAVISVERPFVYVSDLELVFVPTPPQTDGIERPAGLFNAVCVRGF